jgi:hypothetical protein
MIIQANPIRVTFITACNCRPKYVTQNVIIFIHFSLYYIWEQLLS